MSDEQSNRARRFRYFVLSAGAATGLAIVAIMLVSYINRPEKPHPWNGGAITATFTGMSILTDRPVATFRYRFQNHTERDYHLPGHDSIRIVLPTGDGLLRDEAVRWIAMPSVPVGQKISVEIQVDIDISQLADGGDAKGSVDKVQRWLKGMEGFIVLDESNRYEIQLPKPASPKY